MAIKVYDDRIEIGAKVISTTPTGIRIGDSLSANVTAQGYKAQGNFTTRNIIYTKRADSDDIYSIYGGTSTGYVAGGYFGPVGAQNTISKFSFPNASPSVAYGGTLVRSVWSGVGVSSKTHGYVAGGVSPSSYTQIDKYSFTSEGNATDVGDLLEMIRSEPAGQGSSLYGYGYKSRGYSDAPSPVNPDAAQSNSIQKWTFASDNNATDVGDSQAEGWAALGHSSVKSGYITSGNGFSPKFPVGYNTDIERFPFATDSNAKDVGDIASIGQFGSSCQSPSTAYIINSGGGSGFMKFSFASELTSAQAFAAPVNTPVAARAGQHTGVSSVNEGFVCGNNASPGTNQIDKFPFATEVMSLNVATLNHNSRMGHGTQY